LHAANELWHRSRAPGLAAVLNNNKNVLISGGHSSDHHARACHPYLVMAAQHVLDALVGRVEPVVARDDAALRWAEEATKGSQQPAASWVQCNC
jgi:hypothetical protein